MDNFDKDYAEHTALLWEAIFGKWEGKKNG